MLVTLPSQSPYLRCPLLQSGSRIYIDNIELHFFPNHSRCQFHQHFCSKVLRKAFLYWHFRFDILLVQEYCRIFAHKMLVKLTTVKKNFGRFANVNNLMCLLFHCTDWCLVSILRYAYILHEDWLHDRWPDPKKLRSFSLISLFSVFSGLCLVDFSGFVVIGWSYKWSKYSSVEALPQKSLVSVWNATFDVDSSKKARPL